MQWDLRSESIVEWGSCSYLSSDDWDIWYFPTLVTCGTGWFGNLSPETWDAYKHQQHEELSQEDLDNSLFYAVNHCWGLQLHQLQVRNSCVFIKASTKNELSGLLDLPWKQGIKGLYERDRERDLQDKKESNIGYLTPPGKARGCSANIFLSHSLICWLSQDFPPMALLSRHAQMVRNSASRYKIDYPNDPQKVTGCQSTNHAWSITIIIIIIIMRLSICIN